MHSFHRLDTSLGYSQTCFISGSRDLGEAEEVGVINIILRGFTPSREMRIPPKNLFLSHQSKNNYCTHFGFDFEPLR